MSPETFSIDPVHMFSNTLVILCIFFLSLEEGEREDGEEGHGRQQCLRCCSDVCCGCAANWTPDEDMIRCPGHLSPNRRDFLPSACRHHSSISPAPLGSKILALPTCPEEKHVCAVPATQCLRETRVPVLGPLPPETHPFADHSFSIISPNQEIHRSSKLASCLYAQFKIVFFLPVTPDATLCLRYQEVHCPDTNALEVFNHFRWSIQQSEEGASTSLWRGPRMQKCQVRFGPISPFPATSCSVFTRNINTPLWLPYPDPASI